MKKILFICFSVLLVSCSKLPDEQPDNFLKGEGAFIINEGKFLAGNGSLSFFSYDSMEIYNDLFREYNDRPLGDVPYSIVAYGENAYLVVNNSGKIEIIDRNTFLSKGTITGLISPRKMAVVNDGKAYVTSLYSDSIAIIDLKNETISGYINLGKTSEDIVVNENKAYVANWFGGNNIYVIDTNQNKIIGSISVGLEPESMVLDKYNRLWVLCTGGWMKTRNAEIDVINTTSLNVDEKYVFPSSGDNPSCLKIDGTGQNIYFLNKGAWKMDVNADALPYAPVIGESTGQIFYKLAVNPVNGDILITDAVDYIKEGFLLIYKNDGSFVSKMNTGLNPGEICFNLRPRQNQITYIP